MDIARTSARSDGSRNPGHSLRTTGTVFLRSLACSSSSSSAQLLAPFLSPSPVGGPRQRRPSANDRETVVTLFTAAERPSVRPGIGRTEVPRTPNIPALLLILGPFRSWSDRGCTFETTRKARNDAHLQAIMSIRSSATSGRAAPNPVLRKCSQQIVIFGWRVGALRKKKRGSNDAHDARLRRFLRIPERPRKHCQSRMFAFGGLFGVSGQALHGKRVARRVAPFDRRPSEVCLGTQPPSHTALRGLGAAPRRGCLNLNSGQHRNQEPRAKLQSFVSCSLYVYLSFGSVIDLALCCSGVQHTTLERAFDTKR